MRSFERWHSSHRWPGRGRPHLGSSLVRGDCYGRLLGISDTNGGAEVTINPLPWAPPSLQAPAGLFARITSLILQFQEALPAPHLPPSTHMGVPRLRKVRDGTNRMTPTAPLGRGPTAQWRANNSTATSATRGSIPESQPTPRFSSEGVAKKDTTHPSTVGGKCFICIEKRQSRTRLSSGYWSPTASGPILQLAQGDSCTHPVRPQ